MKINFSKFSSLLKQALKEGKNWGVWKFLFSGFGSTAAFFLIGSSLLDISALVSVYVGLGVIVSLYLFRSSILFFKFVAIYLHEVYLNSTYGEAIIKLKNSFAKLHAYRKNPGHQDEQFIEAMVFLCNSLKEIFDDLTKSDCSVSIKVPIQSANVDVGTSLVNLVRDTDHSTPDTKKNRDTQNYRNIPHTIIGNTAFSNSLNKVFQNRSDKYFINNDINGDSSRDTYENTSRQCHENGVLPYQSELVYPIVPLITEDHNNLTCRGFICIDSDKTNAFKSKYHIGIIEGVADGIYDVITERNENINGGADG